MQIETISPTLTACGVNLLDQANHVNRLTQSGNGTDPLPSTTAMIESVIADLELLLREIKGDA